ncbi:MAG TPA: hypothetical protein VFR78_05720 [Pyrinomonadaceae bacterium]|nr:hypothetical protein [Pyrinomonadaceae bacterium]
MKISLLFLVACVLFLNGPIASGQERQRDPGPRTELLTMNGSKPSLSQTGEGITSYKIGDLYQRGSTKITLVKAADAPFKVELPIGYTLFNDLVYRVETNAVFTGPTDVTFSLPSARTKETFDQLRILYARPDYADPDVPRWIDATAEEAFISRDGIWPSEADIRQRFRDFNTRTLHAITAEDEPLVMVIALKDSSKSRERFTADLAIGGTGPAQVTEGRSVTYHLQITNKGPDAASAISLHAHPGFSFSSVEASVGKCRMFAQNVHCTFPSLEKGRTIDVKIIETCPWGPNLPADLPEQGKPRASVGKHITIEATEQDPVGENNHVYFYTEVFSDPNKGPEIELTSPTFSRTFQGPAATVPIRFKASDPDGFIKKLELYTHTLRPVEPQLLGDPTMRSEGEYEFIYKDAPFGRNWIRIVATDNLGRVTRSESMEFFVNGTAKVQITSPKAGSKRSLADGEFTVTIHATHPSSRLKKVWLNLEDNEATPIGNDNYVVKMKYCTRRCELQAFVIDENGVETRSEELVFTMMEAPKAYLNWSDGEYSREFEPGKLFRVNQLVLFPRARHQLALDGKIAKLEVFVDGEPICTEDSPTFGLGQQCVWKASPGMHKLQTVATDEDGAVGKSEVIEVVIERP